MTYGVRFTCEALDDLERLYDFVLERELSRGGDLELAERAVEAIENGIAALSFSPFTCRKAGADPFPPRACDPVRRERLRRAVRERDE